MNKKSPETPTKMWLSGGFHLSKAMVQYPFVNRNQGGDSPMEKENKLGTMPISKLIIIAVFLLRR